MVTKQSAGTRRRRAGGAGGSKAAAPARSAKAVSPDPFGALADPTRRAILDGLRTAPRTAGDIASDFSISRPGVSKHLRVLAGAGLVRVVKHGRERHYQLEAGPLETVDAWVGRYRLFWSASHTWVRADEMGAPTEELGSVYHVTPGGAALVEAMFPGTDEEMLTVDYVKDDALCMTHYCVLGNRRELVADAPTPHAMTFECSEEGCCGDEMHMHAATITIVGQTHVTIVWGGNKEEDGHESITFHLIRQGHPSSGTR